MGRFLKNTLPVFTMSILVCAAALFSQTSTAPSAGDGSAGSPYQIASLDNLYWLSQNSSVWNKCFSLITDLDASSTRFWDTWDGFTPIGTAAAAFSGTFHGNGHTISGLYISRQHTDYVGLFGWVTAPGSIDNLILSNALVYGAKGVGAIAGICGGIIQSCLVKSSSVYVETQCGGILCGWIESNGTISQCGVIDGTIQGNDRTSSDYGGLVGWVNGFVNNSFTSGCKVSNSYDNASRMGGLVGHFYGGSLINCYAMARIQTNQSADFGGLLGKHTGGAVTHCFYDSTHITGNWRLNSTKVGTGKSPSDMHEQSLYTGAGWDFLGESANGTAEIWILNDLTPAGPYPYPYSLVPNGVTTQSAGEISATSARLNGTITFVSQKGITNHGFCWNTTGSPTVANNPISLGTRSGTGTFSWVITGLNSTSTYYCCAFAAYSNSIVYGNTISFTGSSVSNGNGTNESPYLISNYTDLTKIADNLTAVYQLTTDIDASPSRSANGGAGFVPIGTTTTPFTGTIHGHGHSIRNLFINRPANDEIGLVTTCNGTIDSLSMLDCDITGRSDVGGIAGRNGGTIAHCFTNGKVTAGNWNAGGIAGMNTGTIRNSGSAGTTWSSSLYVGGIAGLNEPGTISNCYSTGVTVGQDETGGVAGRNNGGATITNCYSTGSVSGTNYVGSISGTNLMATTSSSVSDNAVCALIGTELSATTTNVTRLTTSAMKKSATFNSSTYSLAWDTTAIWRVVTDSSYPGLRSIDNAPFAFTDTLLSISTCLLSRLLANDYDLETGRRQVVLKVQTISAGTTDSTKVLQFPSDTTGTITLMYRVGEVRTNDTLWGGRATSVVKLIPGTPVIASPASAAVNVPVSTSLRWYKDVHAVSYHVQAGLDSTFTSGIKVDTILSDTAKAVELANLTRYFVRVTATNAITTSDWSGAVSFTTMPPIPAQVVVNTPADSLKNAPLIVTLSWNPLEHVDRYQVAAASDVGFGSTILNDSTIIGTTVTLSNLSSKTTYWYHIRGGNAAGWGAWSTVRLFTTIPPVAGVVVPKVPSNRATGIPVATTLAWDSVTDAGVYCVQLATDTLFQNIIVDDSTLTQTNRAVIGLQNYQTYFWRVRVKNAGGTSGWSEVYSFTTIHGLPAAVVPVSPPANDTITTDSAVCLWHAAANAVTRYWFEYGIDSTFEKTIVSDSTITDTVFTIRGLSNKTYYWHVRAFNEAGWGGYSPAQSLIVRQPITRARPKNQLPREYGFNVRRTDGMLSYALPERSGITIKLYSINGRLLKSISRMSQEPGYYSVFPSNDCRRSGSYVALFTAGKFRAKRLFAVTR